MRKIVLTLIISYSTVFNIFSQSIPCPFVNAGTDQTADCSSAQGCSNLIASFLDIRETSSYTVESIPHVLPIPYNQTGGTQVSANTDDVWSTIITLPFPFCYYGQTYTTCKIGSNGAILFGPATSGGGHPWSFTASLTNNTGINGAGHVLGVYHDIDPSVCGTIKWYVSGTAPCRQFIVSYNEVCHFSCTSIKSTHMMVLNETTNYIDIYVQSKPTCSGWNGGRAVIGLQNIAQNGGIIAPNRNTTPTWNVTTPEGWRFKPAGTPLYTIEWFQGTTSLGTNDSITVCPSSQTTYTAQFTYTKCGSTTPTVLTDEVTITPAPGQITATATPVQSTCGQANGSVSINAFGGSGTLSYSNDNVNYGVNPIFSGLSAGTYTFYVQDQGGCTVSLPVQITDLSTLTASVVSHIDVSCFGGNNGEISVLASSGTPPYSYSINSQPIQTSGVFSNLTAGIYVVSVTDAQGCNYSISDTLSQPTALVITEINNDSTTCNLSNGLIEVSASGGIQNYSYSINQSAGQTQGLFSSLNPGDYTITVTDQNGCVDSINSTIYANPSIDLSIVAVNNVSCIGSTDGIASVFASVGPSPYEYYLANGSPQDFSVFSNLSPGTYTIFGSDANGCVDSVDVTILEPSPVISQVDPTAEVCVGNSVELFASASGGTAPYTFNWVGLTGNPATVTPTTSATYQVIVTDANGCTDTNEVNTVILPYPIAQATCSPTSGGVPLQVTVTNQSQFSNAYSWNFGNGSTTQTSDLSAVNTIYSSDGTFIVELIASNGFCQDSWFDTIVVVPILPLEVDIPNVFTPNGDGDNEGYFVWTKNAASIEAVIVNRWGNTMVIIDDLNYKWDGKTPNGIEAGEGVYFLKYKVIGLDSSIIEGHTFFHLIR